MKKKINYKPAPASIAQAIKNSQVIEDFLPPPEQLISHKEETVRITIHLSKKSVNFFKKTAQQTGIPYQSMIKRVLDIYSQHYK